jgi:hypothetical protein
VISAGQPTISLAGLFLTPGASINENARAFKSKTGSMHMSDKLYPN